MENWNEILLKEYIKQYIKDNLRVNVSCYRSCVDVNLTLDGETISTTTDYFSKSLDE